MIRIVFCFFVYVVCSLHAAEETEKGDEARPKGKKASRKRERAGAGAGAGGALHKNKEVRRPNPLELMREYVDSMRDSMPAQQVLKRILEGGMAEEDFSEIDSQQLTTELEMHHNVISSSTTFRHISELEKQGILELGKSPPFLKLILLPGQENKMRDYFSAVCRSVAALNAELDGLPDDY